MGDVVSAGSYVAAVMELAGYRTQADILDQFQDFFRDAGAFFYVISAVGAVVSFVTLGSFRAVRYLLIGPAIFWLLVTTRAQYDSTIWKIGAGNPRGLHRARGEGASRGDINRAVQQAFGASSGGAVNVAYGFKLFAYPINQTVNGIVGILLNGEEDREYATFLHKGRAMDAFLSVRPRVPFLIRAIDYTLLNVKSCAQYTGYSMALGMPDLSLEQIDAVRNSGGGGTQAAAIMTRRRNYYLEQLRTRYNIDWMVLWDWQVKAQLGLSALQMTIKCEDAWKAVARQIVAARGEAERERNRIVDLAAMEMAPGTGRALACEQLMLKISGERPANCMDQLKNAVAVMMVKNILVDRQALVKFVMAMQNERELRTGRGTTGLSTNIPEGATRMFGGNPLIALESYRPFRYSREGGGGEIVLRPGSSAYADDPTAGDIEAQARARRSWRGGARLTVLGGANLATEASFVDFPRYNTRKLAQQLFTWSLNAPWWQGVLLFIMSIAYPFLALCVLIPGRAQSLFLLPLAWLWVKAWDIGFAMVMVLERVLWNNFPPMRLSQTVLNGSIPDLPLYRILSEGQKTDPIWSIHSYFLVMSVSLLAVPAVMGYVTLRSKRAILASFTDRLLQDVKSAGDTSAGYLQIQAAAGRAQFMHELQGEAIRAMRSPQADQQRMAAASMYGFAEGMQAFQSELIRPGGLDGSRIIQAWSAFQARAPVAMNEMQEAMENHDRAYALMFHPIVGRFGLLGVYYDAEKAGADASGGFEMEGNYQGVGNPVDALIAVQGMRVTSMFNIVNDQARNLWSTSFGRAGMMAVGLDVLSHNNLFTGFGSLLRDETLRGYQTNLEELEREAEIRRAEARLAALPASASDAERNRWRAYIANLIGRNENGTPRARPHQNAFQGADELQTAIDGVRLNIHSRIRALSPRLGQHLRMDTLENNRFLREMNRFMNTNNQAAIDEIVRSQVEQQLRRMGLGLNPADNSIWRHWEEEPSWYGATQEDRDRIIGDVNNPAPGTIRHMERQIAADVARNFSGEHNNISMPEMLNNVFGFSPETLGGLQNPLPLYGSDLRLPGSAPSGFNPALLPAALDEGSREGGNPRLMIEFLRHLERSITPNAGAAFQNSNIPGYSGPQHNFFSPYFPTVPSDTRRFELWPDTIRRRLGMGPP